MNAGRNVRESPEEANSRPHHTASRLLSGHDLDRGANPTWTNLHKALGFQPSHTGSGWQQEMLGGHFLVKPWQL